jgi:hypothetical protein
MGSGAGRTRVDRSCLGSVHHYPAKDHARLDDLLQRAINEIALFCATVYKKHYGKTLLLLNQGFLLLLALQSFLFVWSLA